MCQHFDRQMSGQVSYRVDVDSVGCWEGTRVGFSGEPSWKHLSGCMILLSYLLD